MTTGSLIERFLASRRLAIVGVSRKKNKFGNTVFRYLKERGFEVYPVNPYAREIEGTICFPNLEALPFPIENVLLIIPPQETERLVHSAAEAGIRRIWMQQGTESPQAIRFCQSNGIEVIHGECILMFVEPMGFPHRVHRWIRGVLGKLPD